MKCGEIVEDVGVPFVPAGLGISPCLHRHGGTEIVVGILVPVDLKKCQMEPQVVVPVGDGIARLLLCHIFFYHVRKAFYRIGGQLSPVLLHEPAFYYASVGFNVGNIRIGDGCDFVSVVGDTVKYLFVT